MGYGLAGELPTVRDGDMRQSREERAKSLERRALIQQKKIATFENRPGPEKRSGEKDGEYRERIKRHEYVMERQIGLAEFHSKRNSEKAKRVRES
jgi:hypothetical protein